MHVLLHNHTDASMLDGACKVKQIVAKAKELNMEAIAITDHGNMINSLAFQEECLKNNIKPILGCEFYMGEPDSNNKYHLVLLAKNNEGLKNLFKLNAYSYTKNFYGKPRIDWCSLTEHSNGLICTTACLGSELAEFHHLERMEDSHSYLRKLHNIFHDDLYVELQSNTIKSQQEYNAKLKDICMDFGYKHIITTDTHYVNREDSEMHDTLLCMQTKAKKSDTNRFRFTCKDFYLQNEDEILAIAGQGNMFPFIDKSMSYTLEIADKCNARIETGRNLLPKVAEDADYVLAQHCNEGYARKIGTYNKEIVDRIKFELKIIKEKGYSDYFLIVEDYVKWAKKNGIFVGPGRGSGAGSEVAYVLDITDVEPIKHGLLFERFLNPERQTSPDFDVDFCYERREEVMNYIKDKYGRDNVCGIIAKGKLTAKAVCRRVLTAYGYEQRYINNITKMIPDDVGITLEEAASASDDFNAFVGKHPTEWHDMLGLEGMLSYCGTHAAGVVISPKPVASIIPCMSDSDDRTALVSQFDKKEVEKVGLYKFDFLGLKTLTILRKTIENVKRTRDIDVNLKDIDVTDPRLYVLLNSGNLKGIFQFNAPAGEQIINQVKPECFEDVVACEALCRPGVKERDMYVENKADGHNSYENDIIKKILSPTYGAIVYQEQTMLLMHELAGWSLGKADKMRKVKSLEEFRDDFVRSCAERGIDSSVANSIYSRFSLEYSFNKSHAVSYAILTMQTLYLKLHYPLEFMAATMSMELYASENDIKGMMKECSNSGIKVINPDINISTNEFVPSLTNNSILIPLNMIKQIGENTVDEIIKNRPYTNLEDFLRKVKKSRCNSRHVKNLIKAGCFGSIEKINRSELLKTVDQDCDDFWSKETLVQYEMETMEMRIESNPLSRENCYKMSTVPEGAPVIMKVIVDDTKINNDKSGKKMCFARLETAVEFIDGIAFSYAYSKYGGKLNPGCCVTVEGKKKGNSLIIDRVI